MSCGCGGFLPLGEGGQVSRELVELGDELREIGELHRIVSQVLYIVFKVVRGLEGELIELWAVKLQLGIFTHDEIDVLHRVGQLGQVLEPHHSGGALYRMHYSEYLGYIVGSKLAALGTHQYIVEVFQQLCGFKHKGIQHRFHTRIKLTHKYPLLLFLRHATLLTSLTFAVANSLWLRVFGLSAAGALLARIAIVRRFFTSRHAPDVANSCSGERSLAPRLWFECRRSIACSHCYSEACGIAFWALCVQPLRRRRIIIVHCELCIVHCKAAPLPCR